MRVAMLMLCVLILSGCNTLNGIGRDVSHVGDGLSRMTR
jgi:predicted small secreted protein